MLYSPCDIFLEELFFRNSPFTFVPDINYYHCLKIIDILKETEKDSKNLFGFYGSQRMKDWQEVVSCSVHSTISTMSRSTERYFQ